MKNKLMLLMATGAVAFVANAADGPFEEVVDGVTWRFMTFSSDGRTCANVQSGSEKYSGDLNIPSTLGGCPVTRIGNYAFNQCDGLTSVTIPSGVTRIGFAAFAGCSGLKSVMVPPSVTDISDTAFYNCRGLADEKGFTVVEGILFGYFGDASSVVIPSSVTKIGRSAFTDHDELTSVTITPNVKSVELGAFARCDALTSVLISPGLECIGNGAFSWCSSLASVTLPPGLLSIGDSAFRNCDALASVTIPETVTNVGSLAFTHCGKLATVTAGSNIWQMGKDAFSNTPLMQVDGDKREIAYLGNCALGFKTCLIDGVRRMAADDFYGDNENVQKIDIVLKEGTSCIADNAFYSIRFKTKGGLSSEYTIPYGQVVLPDGLQTIGAGAFSSTFYPGSHRDLDLLIPASVVCLGDGSLSGIVDRRICFEGPRPQTDGTPFSQDHSYGGEDISTVYYVSGTEGWNFGGQWCGVRTYPYAWLEKRASQIKLGLVYEFDRDPGEHWLVHKEEVEDDEYFAIPVTGAASASEVSPVVLHHNSSSSDISSIEIWTDAQMFNAVLKPLLSLKDKWRTHSRYDGSYIECPTSGEEAVWPADMWPDDEAVPGRFWIVAKPNAGPWHGMRDFRIGLFGTDEVTERIYLANSSAFGPPVTDKACLDTKRVAYSGRSAPHMGYGRTFCPGGIGSWGDCLGGTMFKTEGVRPASFTATVKEPGLFALSVADSDYIWDEGTQTGHYIGENFKSQMTVSGGRIVADTEESLDERLDAASTNLYWRYGGGGCIRRITVGAAGTYTFASKSHDDICANRFHFFPKNRDSVAIDAICMEAQKCNSCSHDIANGYVLGSGVYVAGETATFTAVPAPGERFDHWEVAFGELPKGLDLESATLSFAVTSDMCGAMQEERQVVIRAVWKKKCRPEIIPSPVGAATVSGNMSVFLGEEGRVTLTLSAGCSVSRWIDGSAAGLLRAFSFSEADCEEPYRAILTGTPASLTPQIVVDDLVASYVIGVEIAPISVWVSANGYSVAVSGVPAGLSYANGQISGVPAKLGSFVLTATATKAGAPTLVRQFTVMCAESYTLVFVDNNETWAKRTYVRDCVYKLPKCTLPDGGKTFVGWRCLENGRRYDDGMLVFNLAQPGETVTMTAIWE